MAPSPSLPTRTRLSSSFVRMASLLPFFSLSATTIQPTLAFLPPYSSSSSSSTSAGSTVVSVSSALKTSYSPYYHPLSLQQQYCSSSYHTATSTALQLHHNSLQLQLQFHHPNSRINLSASANSIINNNNSSSKKKKSVVRLFATSSGSSLPEASYRVQASHILVKEEKEADEIMQDLKDGKKSFAEIAMEKSQCPSKAKGGDLGAFGRGEMVPEFETACFDNEAGALVKTKTQFGWHVIEVGPKLKMPLEVDPVMIKEWIDTNGSETYQLIDVREKEETDKAVVEGFKNLPLSEIQTWGPKVMAGEELDKEKPTIVMCHHGMRSMQVAMFLSGQAGFQDVYNIAGGIDAYARNVDSSITRY